MIPVAVLCIPIALAGPVSNFVLTATPESLPQVTATGNTWSLSSETECKSTTPPASAAKLQSKNAYSAPVTIAPLTINPMMQRQKCFNDQGFSVDCATWTGYYYTWGPPGNPYEGGPGEGQSGSGSGSSSGGNSGLVYQSGSSFPLPALVVLIGASLLLLVVML